MIDADTLFRVFRGLFVFLRQELDAQYDKIKVDVKENAHFRKRAESFGRIGMN
jgi:hypothetical protein